MSDPTLRGGTDSLDQHQKQALGSVPSGTVALSSIAVLLLLAWLAIYLFVYLPRGMVG